MLNTKRAPTVLRRHTSEVRTSVIATAALLALSNRTLHGAAASLPAGHGMRSGRGRMLFRSLPGQPALQ